MNLNQITGGSCETPFLVYGEKESCMEVPNHIAIILDGNGQSEEECPEDMAM